MRNLAPALVYSKGFLRLIKLKSMHFNLPSQRFSLFYAKTNQNCNYTRQWLGITQHIWNQTNSNELLIHIETKYHLSYSLKYSAHLTTIYLWFVEKSFPNKCFFCHGQFQGSLNLQMKCFKIPCNIVLISRRIKWETFVEVNNWMYFKGHVLRRAFWHENKLLFHRIAE